MKPREYDINLELPLGAEIRFSIDPNQFSGEVRELPDCLEHRFNTREEATETAQAAADLVGHEVEVEVVGFWGFYGCEKVDTFTVQPNSNAQPRSGAVAA